MNLTTVVLESRSTGRTGSVKGPQGESYFVDR